jgi:2-dehydro-3-deoxyphosphogluconate aldolase/(4S)-4-hydroxy-2-oxoglutarate aldolase
VHALPDESPTVLGRACAQGLIPVAVIDDRAAAAPLGRALSAAGGQVIEVTFRTAAAERAVADLAEQGMLLVGAGTVVRPEQVDAARAAGARFVVSPGFDLRVVERCLELGLPVVPGVASASEIMAALGAGLSLVKLFPAEPLGGVALVRALHGPFPDVRFIPTGGLTVENAPGYLRLPSVAAIGGSWMVAPSLIAAGEFDQITRLTAAALAVTAAR